MQRVFLDRPRWWVVLRAFWSTALASHMEYRGNFLLALLTSVGMFSGSFLTLSILFRHTPSLGGWDFHQSLAVMGTFMFLNGVSLSLFSPNLNRIVDHVRTGTLDFVLLKPVDTQFWLSLRYLEIHGLPEMLLGGGVVGYVYLQIRPPWTATLAGFLLFLAALILLYSIWFMLASLSIWFVKIYNVTAVLQTLLEAGRFPVHAYPLFWKFVFTFVIPIAFITTLPAQMWVQGPSWGWVLLGWGVALVAFAGCRAFWHYARRHYTSASS